MHGYVCVHVCSKYLHETSVGGGYPQHLSEGVLVGRRGRGNSVVETRGVMSMGCPVLPSSFLGPPSQSETLMDTMSLPCVKKVSTVVFIKGTERSDGGGVGDLRFLFRQRRSRAVGSVESTPFYLSVLQDGTFIWVP